MPSTTIRQQIVDKLKLRLARIRVANGFQTDIGVTAADDWPTQFQDTELREATRLGIFDRENDITQEMPRQKKAENILGLQVRIFHQRGTTPEQLRVMLADVMKAIIEHEDTGARDPQWRTYDTEANAYVHASELAVDTKPLRDGFVVPQPTFQIDAGAIEFQVEFLAQPFNAYE